MNRIWQHTIRHVGATRTAAFAGELDLDATAEVAQLIAGQITDPIVTTVFADLAEVTFIDSTLIGALVNAHQLAEAASRSSRSPAPTATSAGSSTSPACSPSWPATPPSLGPVQTATLPGSNEVLSAILRARMAEEPTAPTRIFHEA
jgi:ABC-type transporter Mla MlaB component